MEPIKEFKKYHPTLHPMLDGSFDIVYHVYDGKDFRKKVMNVGGPSAAQIELEHQESLLVLSKLQRFINQQKHFQYSFAPGHQGSAEMAIKELQAALNKLYPHKISRDRCRYYIKNYLLGTFSQIQFRSTSAYFDRQAELVAFLLMYAEGQLVITQKVAA